MRLTSSSSVVIFFILLMPCLAKASLMVADDVNYLPRLQAALENSDLIVEAKLTVETNTRVVPMVAPDHKAALELHEWLTKYGPKSAWMPIPEGQLSGILRVESFLRGALPEGDRLLQISFPMNIYLVPKDGVLVGALSMTMELEQDIEDGQRIWLLKKQGDYTLVSRNPSISILPGPARHLVDLLIAQAPSTTLVSGVEKLIMRGDSRVITFGLRLIGGLTPDNGLILTVPYLFSESFMVREAALYAFRAMSAQVNEEIFLRLADKIDNVKKPAIASQALSLISELLGDDVGMPKRSRNEESAYLKDVASWLRRNTGKFGEKEDKRHGGNGP